MNLEKQEFMADPTLRILVVEDQSDLRRALVAMLKQIGIRTVQKVANSEEAVEFIRENPVDFILCEWDAPGISGLDFLRFIRSNSVTKFIPLVMISGRDQMDDDAYAEASDYDVDGHLTKPLSQERLELLLTKIMEKREKFRESSVHLSRAAAYADMGAMEEAEAELDSAHKMPPESPQFWVDSAELFQVMGSDEKAKNCYQQAAEVDAGYARAYEGLSDILEKEGKADEALEMLQKSVAISPRNRERQMKMAKTLLNNGDEFGARTALYQAFGDETDEAARSAEAAEFFMESGRADLAEAEYAFALEADPNNVHYYNRMGLAFRRQKKIDDAIENYQKALKVAPNDHVLYYNMAIAQMEGSKIEPAMAALRKALTLKPDFSQAEAVLKKLRDSAKPAAKSPGV
jgi:tetratricopeptide (TPR) repeat protein